jgi:hypothetical protein
MNVILPYIGPNIWTLRCGICFDEVDVGTALRGIFMTIFKMFVTLSHRFSVICTCGHKISSLKQHKFTAVRKLQKESRVCGLCFATDFVKLGVVVKLIVHELISQKRQLCNQTDM